MFEQTLQHKLRSIFRKEDEGIAAPAGASHTLPPISFRHKNKQLPIAPRQSRGLEQFFFNLKGQVGLHILDFAGASQENIDFLTSLGHKIYSQNVIAAMDEAFGKDPSGQLTPGRIEHFLNNCFDYPVSTFDGVLMWDSMQFMGPALLTATADRLFDIMRPQSYVLAFFSADERAREAQSHAFRIQDNKTLLVTPRDLRTSGQVFNNRSLEKLFAKFESVKFFLTRENLREVIVRR